MFWRRFTDWLAETAFIIKSIPIERINSDIDLLGHHIHL